MKTSPTASALSAATLSSPSQAYASTEVSTTSPFSSQFYKKSTVRQRQYLWHVHHGRVRQKL